MKAGNGEGGAGDRLARHRGHRRFRHLHAGDGRAGVLRAAPAAPRPAPTSPSSSSRLTAESRRKIRGLRSGGRRLRGQALSTRAISSRARRFSTTASSENAPWDTLKGNLREVGLCEILQLFELTRKRGVLHVDADAGKGTIAFADGTLMDAAWNDLQGEDAVLEMFALTDGSFRFQSQEVSVRQRSANPSASCSWRRRG
ncbi:MAG: DUF4388 domain-containing protein [Candidatus Moduliflexus flocculans]|nr:DUF4388 domain-containing protein [Candidatus Moduliflexus flocculans]